MAVSRPETQLAAPALTSATQAKQGFHARVRRGLEFEQSRREVPQGFPALPPIPAGRYTDADFLKLEYEFLWKKSWLYVCHADQVAAPGDYILWNESRAPVIVVREKDGAIRAFYNTCRHRGAPLVTSSAGAVKGGFTCPYHGWSYGLDGSLLGIRDRRDFPDLDFSCMGLVPVRCESLGNWVFLNEDPDASPLLESLHPLAEQFSLFEPERVRHIDSQRFDVACNVKVLLDGLLEVYHLKTIHPRTADRFLDHRGTSQTLFSRGHSLMVTPNRSPDWIDPGTAGMMEFSRADDLYRQFNVSFNLFPALVTPVSATGMPFLALYPTGDNTMRLDCHWFSPDWGDGDRHPLWDKRISNFVRILQEDLQLVPLIQNSMESPGFTGIQPGYQERRIYNWHEELDRRIGPERVPEHLRIQPKLAAWTDQGIDQ